MKNILLITTGGTIASLESAVIADEKTRIQRIVARDNISKDDAKLRISKQYSDVFFKERAHFCIYNSHGDNVTEQMDAVLRQIGSV